MNNDKNVEMATLAGGCFWCLEAVFVALRGVQSVTSGYTGGHVQNPSYKDVCAGTTGHAEAVQIIFDPALISYQDILEIFFSIHDPTTPNRQGHDVGTQYRSAIYYHNQTQQQTAKAVIAEQAKIWDAPIVTELVPAATYYVAEEYHHNYFANNPRQPYCMAVVAPKVLKARQKHANKFRQV